MSVDSPELAPITLVGLTEQNLIDMALADASVKMPDWTPREGHTEVVILEAKALMLAELIYTLNQLPDAVTDAVIGLYGLTIDVGAPPSASFEFTTSAADSVTVPAGTRVTVIYNTSDGLDFLTNTDLLIPAGGAATVVATAVENTASLNGTTISGLTVELVDAILAVDTVDLVGPIGGGRSAEAQTAYRQRGANLFRRLTETLVLAPHFTSAALEDPAVTRATTIDNYNGVSGTPGTQPGHVSVAVAGPGGVALTVDQRTALLASLTAKAYAGLAVHVISPTVTPVNVTATIVLTPGANAAAVIAAVKTTLEAYLNPDAWAWGGTVYRNELIAIIDGVPGVARVGTLTTPATDFALSGVAPLADAGTLTITSA